MKSTFKITGMTCQGCANAIEHGLQNDPSILMATVSLQDRELTTESTKQLNNQYINSIISLLGNYMVENPKENVEVFKIRKKL